MAKKNARILFLGLAVLTMILMISAAYSFTAWADTRAYTAEDAQYIAKTLYGEARGCTVTEQAAVVWCILNRVDSELFPNSIEAVITQPYQFGGYRSDNPVAPELLVVSYDVLARWVAEDSCIGSIGRVLPAQYLFFSGDGHRNTFRTEWRGGTVWALEPDNPYDEMSGTM